MKLGILYAMEKEAAGLLSAVTATPLESRAGMPLYALPGGHILCVGGVGKVNAAMATGLLLDRFGAEGVLNAGCAGALTDLAVGAVVTADYCVQHDVDTSLAGDPVGLVSTVNVTQFSCVPAPLPGAVVGTVASGDWFGRDFDRARAIRARYNALVCDMEACAAAQVCLRWGKKPCMVVKAVSDHLLSPDQGREYQENFSAAMAALDAAVAAIIQRQED